MLPFNVVFIILCMLAALGTMRMSYDIWIVSFEVEVGNRAANSPSNLESGLNKGAGETYI